MKKYLIPSALLCVLFSLAGNAAMMTDLTFGADSLVRFLMMLSELLTVIFMAICVIMILSKESQGALLALLCFSVLTMFVDRLAMSTAYLVAIYD